MLALQKPDQQQYRNKLEQDSLSQVIHEQHLQMEAVDAQSLRRVSFGYHRRPVSPQASIKQCIDGAQNTEPQPEP